MKTSNLNLKKSNDGEGVPRGEKATIDLMKKVLVVLMVIGWTLFIVGAILSSTIPAASKGESFFRAILFGVSIIALAFLGVVYLGLSMLWGKSK